MTSTQEAAEILAADLANRQGKGLDLPPSNPDAVAHHLAVAETAERKWGFERRKAIANARYAKRNEGGRRDDVTRFVRDEKSAVSMQDFFDNIATEADVEHVEYLLGIREK